MLKKDKLYVLLIVIALFLLALDHLDSSLGDRIFTAMGISPWTGENQTGLHLSVCLGYIVLFIGIGGAVRIYRPQYPKILSRIIIGCIVFVICYPLVTERVMFVLKNNSDSITSIDYSKKNSECNIRTEGNQVKAVCSLTLFNYGNVKEVKVKPILMYNSSEISFESSVIHLSPHYKDDVEIDFHGIQHNGTDFSGSTQEFGLEIEVNGDLKIVK